MFMDKMVKNDSFEPDLRKEGTYICPFPRPPPPPNAFDKWHSHLSPHERLYYHRTMSSVRYSKRFRANPNIPKDSLDFQLQARYDHGRETFPENIDVVLQRDTCPALTSWAAPHGQKEVGSISRVNVFRVLRNTRIVAHKMEDTLGHPLVLGKAVPVQDSDSDLANSNLRIVQKMNNSRIARARFAPYFNFYHFLAPSLRRWH